MKTIQELQSYLEFLTGDNLTANNEAAQDFLTSETHKTIHEINSREKEINISRPIANTNSMNYILFITRVDCGVLCEAIVMEFTTMDKCHKAMEAIKYTQVLGSEDRTRCEMHFCILEK